MTANTRSFGWAASLAVLTLACSGSQKTDLSAEDGEPTEVLEHNTRIASFQPRQPVSAVERKRIIAQALNGTVPGTHTNLGSRMMVRTLNVPHPPAGAAARFNFGGQHRGWVVTLPQRDLVPTPAFGNGKIFVSGGFASRRMFALDAYKGELEWALNAPDGGPSAAIYHDGKVIFNAESCTLFVADAETGKIIWHKWLGDPLMSQPVVSGNLVLTAHPTKGNKRHVFAAFTLAKGDKKWATPIPADIIRVPQVSGDSAYFSTMDGTAFRVRVRDGKIMWRSKIGASSAMWVAGDRVLVTRRGRKNKSVVEQPVALSIKTGRIASKGAWYPAPYLAGHSRDRKLIHKLRGAWGSVPKGNAHLGLRNVAAGWAFQGSSPSVADGRAYFAIGGDIRARDVRTGKELWRRTYKKAAGAQAVSPPAIVGAQLVFGTVDGHIYFADIDTGMTIRAYAVGEPVLFQPIVAQGWVYFATARGRVIGLELGDEKFDGWHMWGGNAQHTGLVANAGKLDPKLVASRARPGQGSLRMIVPATEKRQDVELPLLRTVVDADVSGFVSRVHVAQSFTNPHKKPIEAVYRFPLPESAAVDDMVMHIGKRSIRAVIKTKNAARKTYTKAKKAGKRAALLEQQRPNLFVQRVANIPPGQRIDVRISYVQRLPFDSGKYAFVFPMVAPPRFDAKRPLNVIAKPGELRRGSDIDITLRLAPGMKLNTIASSSHQVKVERAGSDKAVVRLASGERIPNRDFRLAFGVGGKLPAAAALGHLAGAKDGYVSLYIQPPNIKATADKREVLFVVDTSSSIRGAPAAQARALITRVVEGLRPGDTFNIYRFSDRVNALAGQSLPAARRGAAKPFIEALRGSGATMMVPALTTALSAPADSRRTRIVVVITDGFTANEADVLRAMATRLGHARIFPVGVGSSPNRFLIERLAEVGRGLPTYVAPGESATAAARAFGKRIDRPVLTDVAIHWGQAKVTDVYPRRIPDLFAGRPLVVHGRYVAGGKYDVTITGRLAGRRYTKTLSIALPTVVSKTNAAHKTLWARAAVRDRMNRLYLRDDPTLIAEVTQLGLAHHLVTQWTSFVAVDHSVKRVASHRAAAPRTTITPARSLPGDPEVRVPAPADARAVTIVLPFGKTIRATYEPRLSAWTGRFLIPKDATDGSYPIHIIITHASGRVEQLRVWYTVDSSAPLVKLEVVGAAKPGSVVTLRASQRITAADFEQSGLSKRTLSPAQVQLLSDAKHVRGRGPNGRPIVFAVKGPGVWEASYRIPVDARGTLVVKVVSVDIAANVRRQTLRIRVAR